MIVKNNDNRIWSDKKSAFTLIETIIYISILSLTIVGFVSFVMSVSNARNKNSAVVEVQANARQALEIISQKIRSASDVNLASSSFGVDPGVLNLVMKSPAKNPTIIKLDKDNGTLTISEGTGNAVALISNKIYISNLIFSYYTGTGRKKNIGVNATFNYYNPSGGKDFEYSQTLRSSISLR